MKHIIAIIFALLACSVRADGLSLEVSAGATQYEQTGNMIWYQKEFPHQLNLTSQSWGVGVSGQAWDRTRWIVEYKSLGYVTSEAWATSDPVYAAGCRSNCTPYDVFKAEGSVRGVVFALAPEWRINGKTKFFVEGGMFLFLPQFHVNIRDSEFSHYAEGWRAHPMLGAGIQYERIKSIVRLYRTDVSTRNADHIPNWQGNTIELSVGYVF